MKEATLKLGVILLAVLALTVILVVVWPKGSQQTTPLPSSSAPSASASAIPSGRVEDDVAYTGDQWRSVEDLKTVGGNWRGLLPCQGCWARIELKEGPASFYAAKLIFWPWVDRRDARPIDCWVSEKTHVLDSGKDRAEKGLWRVGQCIMPGSTDSSERSAQRIQLDIGLVQTNVLRINVGNEYFADFEKSVRPVP